MNLRWTRTPVADIDSRWPRTLVEDLDQRCRLLSTRVLTQDGREDSCRGPRHKVDDNYSCLKPRLDMDENSRRGPKPEVAGKRKKNKRKREGEIGSSSEEDNGGVLTEARRTATE